MIQLPDIKSMTDRNKAFAVANVLGEVFGVSSPIFLPWGRHRSYQGQLFPDVEFISVAPEDKMTSFGVPVYGSFRLKADGYNSYDDRGNVKVVEMAEMQMPYSCLAEFSRAMIMTQTQTLGANGTVKEIYGLDDWQIKIRGVA